MKFEASLQQLHLSLQLDIEKVASWMRRWHLSPNLNKTKALIIGCASADNIALYFPGSPQPIEMVSGHKHLGVVIDSALSWSEHMISVRCRTSSALGALLSHFSISQTVARCYSTDAIFCLYSRNYAEDVTSVIVHWPNLRKGLFRRR